MSDLNLKDVNTSLANQTAAAEAEIRQELDSVDVNSQAALTELQFDIGVFNRLAELRSNIISSLSTMLTKILSNIK